MDPAVSYTRVSTEEQAREGVSLQAQGEIVADCARRHGLRIVQAFSDVASGWHPGGRPGYADMLAFLSSHPEVQTVIAYKLDRLYRNPGDFASLDELADVRIISATEGIPGGPTGRLLKTILMGAATHSSDLTSERVRDSALQKVRNGGWPGPAPTGYVNNRITKTIEPDPIMAPIVTRVFETYANEMISLRELVKRARELGLRTRYGGVLGKGALHHLITHPFYLGLIRFKGKIYPGDHAPLVTQATFDRVQERLKGKATPKGERRNFPFRGLLTCAYCGCQLTAELKKGRYIYYHCTQSRGKCEQPWVRQEAMAERLRAVVEHVRIAPEIVEELIRELENEGEARRRNRRVKIMQMKSELQRLSTRRREAYVEKLEGRIDESLWSDVDTALADKIAAAQGEIERLSSTREPKVDDTRRTLELLERGPELYSLESPEDQARHIQWLSSNCVVFAESIDPVYRKPFAEVAKGNETGLWLPG